MDTPSSSPVIFSSDVQFPLDLLDVFVKCTEYCHQQFGLFNLHYLFYDYTLLCLISN